MAATGGRYTQTVPLDPDESYELRGLRQTRWTSIAPQESRHRTGRRCLVRRRRPRWNSGARRFSSTLSPFSLMKLLSPGLSLPDLPRSVCVAVTNAARPWRASWSAVIFVIAGLPGRQPRAISRSRAPITSPTAPVVSESARLDARPRRTGLAVDSRSSSSCLAPSEVVEPGGSWKTNVRDAKKAPNESIWLMRGVHAA